MREKDYSHIIHATVHLLAEICRDGINRRAALADDNTPSLTDKLQITAKAFIWIKQADKDSEQERMFATFEITESESLIKIFIFIKAILATKLLILSSNNLPSAIHSSLQLYKSFYTPQGACVWDTSRSTCNLIASPTSDQVSANIYKKIWEQTSKKLLT